MSFFFMLLAFWGLLHIPLLNRFTVTRTSRNKAAVAMGLSFLITGSLHFSSPERFDFMMPPYLPFPRKLIYISGVFEILGGLGIILPRTRRLAGLGLALLLICVLPANIHVAMSGGHVPGLPEQNWYYWVRLPFQLVFVLWALWSSRRSYDL
jgi:uncharacterized membrane protein